MRLSSLASWGLIAAVLAFAWLSAWLIWRDEGGPDDEENDR